MSKTSRDVQVKSLVEVAREARSLVSFIEMLAEETTDEIVRGTAQSILDRGPVKRLRKLLLKTGV